MQSKIIAAAAGAFVSVLVVPAAFAVSTDVVSDVELAAKAQGEAPGEAGIAVGKSRGEVVTQTPSVALAVPAGAVSQTDTATIVKGQGGSDIVFQRVGDRGYRASIHISSPDDPERYRFEVRGASRLEQLADGSVYAYDTHDEVVAIIKAPWARDRAQKEVPTHYELDGTALVQVVNHRGGGFEYGITADPFLGLPRYALCAGALGLFIGGNMVLVAKIRKVGGIAKAVKRLFEAASLEEKGKVLLSIFGEVSGVNGVIAACK